MRGQGGWTSRGGGVGIVILSCQDFACEIQIFKKIFGLRSKSKMIRGNPYLETTASRPRAVLSSAHFAKPTARGAGVPVARGGKPSPGEGVPVASLPLATDMYPVLIKVA